MDSDGELILRERRRRRGLRLREEDDIGEDERRERRRRSGWTEEALEENDRIRAITMEESHRARDEIEQQAARDREEEEEEKKRNPASRKAMVGLRVPAVGETREQDCAVCLEEFVDGGKKLRMMPCSHSFHQRCIFDWLDRDYRCPICRYALESRWEEEQLMLLCQEEQAAASVS